MRSFIVILLVLMGANAHAAIFCESPAGSRTNQPSLATALTVANCPTVVVTSAISGSFANISSATLPGGAWPPDRALKVENGGSIAPTTKFTGLGHIDVWPSGSDDTAYISKVISMMTSGGVVNFHNGTYTLGALSTIAKPITLDFHGSYIKPATTGIMFTMQQTGADSNAESIVIKNATVIAGTSNPSDIVKIMYGTINPLLDNFNVQAVTATHAYVWNNTSYGLHIKDCKFRNGTTPAVIKLDQSDVSPTIFSITVDIDHCDISNIDGIGISADGGSMTVRGFTVIEGCTGGAIVHNSVAYAASFDIQAYFEQNYTHDLWLNATTGGNYNVHGCTFGDGSLATSSYNHIIVGGNTYLTLNSNKFNDGGVTGTTPAYYDSNNNILKVSSVTGYSSTGFDRLLSDTLRGRVKGHFNEELTTQTVTAASNTTVYAVQNQSLAQTAYDEWEITAGFNPAIGINEVFHVFVNIQDLGIYGTVTIDKQDYETLTLNVAPAVAWVSGDLITGATSGATCEIVGSVSSTVYHVKYRTKDFTAAETLSNGTNAATQTAAYPTTATTTGISHTILNIVDNGNNTYSITAQASGASAMTYRVTYLGNRRIF